mgnify:CR=1 FL=1
MIRKALNIISKKLPDTPAMPGEVSEKCKSDGKVHTSGYIKGGKIAMSFPANRMLGVAFVGRNHVLSNWKFLFNSISCSLCFFSSFDGSNASFVSSMPVVCVTACCEW